MNAAPPMLAGEHLILQKAAHDLLATAALPAQLRVLRDGNGARGFSAELWQQMSVRGWAGLLVPEEHGGVDFGFAAAGIVFEEIGRRLCVSPLLSSAVLGATALGLCASRDLKARLLPAIANGSALVTLAVDESPRGAPDVPVAVACRDTAGVLRLTGTKRCVLDGATADWLIVSAREAGDPDGKFGLYALDSRAQEVVISSALQLDSRQVATVEFRDAPVMERMSTHHGEEALLADALDAGRACLAAELLGIAEEAFARTVEYSKVRKQFGVAIGSFQALQHRMAALYCEIEMARSAVVRALAALDGREDERATWVSLAKAKAGQVARRVTQEAIQMHGGIGMTDECEIGFFLKRSRAAESQLGDTDFHAERFAAALGF